MITAQQAQRRSNRPWTLFATLILPAVLLSGAPALHAQQSGPTIYECDSETVDSNYYNDYVEQTVCLSGDASGLDFYNEVDLERYQQNVLISAIGADAQLSGPTGFWDTGEQQTPGSYSATVSGWVPSPQLGAWYYLYGLYDECDDPSSNGDPYGCNWTGLMYGDSLSGMITATPTPTVSVSSSGNPSTWAQGVTFTATISSGPYGSITFYDGGTAIGTGTIGGTTASIAISNLAPGNHSITAVWPGSANYNAATSSPIMQTVNQPPNLVYGYSMGDMPNSVSGYSTTGAGDVLAYVDSVMGAWSVGYDSLNRMNSASFSPSVAGISNFCWQYDNFGNRTNEYGSNQPFTATQPCQPASGGSLSNTWTYYTIDGTGNTPDNGKNQITSTPVGFYSYDSAGDILNDGVHQYLYDAEGRICAAYDGSTYTAYVYDGLGQRLATATVGSFSCNRGLNIQSEEFFGADGEELTGVSASGNGGSTLTWQHTNVYGPTGLFATYDPAGLHFIFSDWVGNRRVQTNYAGGIEQTCQNFPYGNTTNCTATGMFSFAGLQNDAAGLYHADARQYAPNMGRWTEPDPFDDSMDASDPQTLNRYDYAGNSPLNFIDPTGLFLGPVGPGGGLPGPPIFGGGGFPGLPPIFGGGGGGGSRGSVSSKKRPPVVGSPDFGVPDRGLNGDLLAALGLPNSSCEFGACYDPTSMGFGPGVGGVAIGGTAEGACIILEPCGAGEGVVIAVAGTLLAVADIVHQVSSAKSGSTSSGSAKASDFPTEDWLVLNCRPGRIVTEPATGRAYRGGQSIEQEMLCSTGVYTIHTIIVGNKIVHGPHVRPGPPKGSSAP
jgi:RHS repeat-associated protein